MDFKEISVSMRNWIDPIQDRDYWRAHVITTLFCKWVKYYSVLYPECFHERETCLVIEQG